MANDSSETYELGKLFVGGLSWETKEDSLRKYFGQFGEISEAVVVIKNNQHQGFGFVTFANPDVVESVLYSNNPAGHYIDGKKVDPKRATKSGQPQKVKVFIGGIPLAATEDDIREAFSVYGSIAVNGVELKCERQTDKRRGFGFVTYEKEDSATNAVLVHHVIVLGKQVEVKLAEHNKKAKAGGGGFNQSLGSQNPTMYNNYQQQYQQPQTHAAAAYGYGSGHSGGYSGYPQWPGYDQYTQGASAGYYQGSSGAANYSSGYGNSYNASRTDSAGASYSTPQAQGYSYPQQQQQQQSYAGYSGYSGGGGGAARSQQGYNGSFPPR